MCKLVCVFRIKRDTRRCARNSVSVDFQSPRLSTSLTTILWSNLGTCQNYSARPSCYVCYYSRSISPTLHQWDFCRYFPKAKSSRHDHYGIWDDLFHCCSMAWDRLFHSRLCVCLSVFHLCYGHNSHSVLMKVCTIVWNPKVKIEFVGGQNPTTPSPIFPHFFTPMMHCQWQGLNFTDLSLVDRLWRLIA